MSTHVSLGVFKTSTWKIEDYEAEKAQYYPKAEEKIKKIVKEILQSMEGIEQVRGFIKSDFMPAAQQISDQKGYAFKAKPFFDNASNLEKMLMLETIEQVDQQKSVSLKTLEKADVTAISILFGMEKIHNLSVELSSPQTNIQVQTPPNSNDVMKQKLDQLKQIASKYNMAVLDENSKMFFAPILKQIEEIEKNLGQTPPK